MRTLTLQRSASTDQGTPGVLLTEDGRRVAWTLELPWRGNAHRMSCIPLGTYRAHMVTSRKFGRVYLLEDVPGRDSILMHTGNWAGDVAKGYKSHVLGCILLGRFRGRREGQLAVMVSRPAVTALEQEVNSAPFTLVVKAKE